jgi:aromatic-L-amino-acid/L-tryptophan decarboxylase
MTAEEFRRHGRQVVDWIADYWDGLPDRPVATAVKPGEITAALAAGPTEHGEGLDAVLADLSAVVAPGLTHWQHPGFFGYFPANTSGPSVLGDLLCAGLGVQGMLWSSSPACTELETVVLDWLADLLDLPAAFRSTGTGGGVIQDSASSATLVAVLAALHRASAGRWAAAGVDRRYAVYTSEHGHSSIEKAARIAGLGRENLRLVPVDPATQAMLPRALRAAVEADLAAGVVPAIVVATIGTTSTTAIDPIPDIGALAREYGLWLHVDAAYAGAAAACPELRWTHAGVELADSYAFDPHKWLLTGFDCDAFWVADRAALIRALSVLPEYLRDATSASTEVIDYRDWQVSLGRRFRALKLWLVLRWYGVQGVRAHVRTGVELADRLAGWIAADGRFELAAPHPFSLVCFRLRGVDEASADAATAELLRRVNADGRVLLTNTYLAGRYTLRLAIGSPQTAEAHVRTAWDLLRSAADELLSS